MPKILVIALTLIFGISNTADGAAATPDPLSFDVVSKTDLTSAFHTKTPWSLIITEDTASADNAPNGNGNLYFCFIHNGKPSCPNVAIPFCTVTDIKQTCPGDSGGGGDPLLYNIFQSASVYQRKDGSTPPILVVEAGANWGGPGSPFGPIIWVYRPRTDSFDLILAATGSGNRNTEARFVSDGPLAGDVIVAINDPTGHWPWPYGIEVYKLLPSGRYIKVLNFIGKSAQAGGPPGPVIDADMPEILVRLHLSK